MSGILFIVTTGICVLGGGGVYVPQGTKGYRTGIRLNSLQIVYNIQTTPHPPQKMKNKKLIQSKSP